MRYKQTIGVAVTMTFVAFLCGIAVFSGVTYTNDTADISTSADETGSTQSTSRQEESGKVSEDKTIREVSHQASNGSKTSSPRTVDTKKSSFTQDKKEYPIRTYAPLAMPNDPYADQWWTASSGTSTLWSNARPAVDTTLAIIDTGFALQHEEFVDRWYKNPGESGPATSEAPSKYNCTDQGVALSMACNLIDDDRDGIVDNEIGGITYENPSQLNCTDQGRELTKDCNLIDDDSNGYADDTTGWDFMNFDRSVQAGEVNPLGSGTTHGTLVAGVAAATGDNARGVAGVDWGTKILPLQAIDDDSYGDTISVGDAIYYAVDQNVDVISVSLGSELPDEYVRGAVQAALKQGIIVVAAAGNDGCECMVYPAHYPEVFAVGALGYNSTSAASFSSYGQSLDVLAPGENMSSTTWSPSNETSAYTHGVNGTSFATPYVGGLLTRLLAERSDATPQQLIASVVEQTSRTGLSSAQSRTNTYGFGSVHAANSLNRMKSPLVLQQQYVFSPVQKGSYLGLSEMNGSYTTYRCSDRPGSTPIYQLSKSGSTFFTISEAERAKAQRQAYTSTLFAYGCITQSHDQATIERVRTIDIFKEFRNISGKQY